MSSRSVIMTLLICAVLLAATILNRFHAARRTGLKYLPVDAASLLRHEPGGAYTNAKSTLVEFGDYQCPPCHAVQPHLANVLFRLQSKLAFDYRHLPNPRLHPYAWEAATAAEIARQRGKFALVHQHLLQANLTRTSVQEVMRHDGFPNLFADQVVVSKAINAVQRDVALARSLHIDSTPTFLLCTSNGVYQVTDLEALITIVN